MKKLDKEALKIIEAMRTVLQRFAPKPKPTKKRSKEKWLS